MIAMLTTAVMVSRASGVTRIHDVDRECSSKIDSETKVLQAIASKDLDASVGRKVRMKNIDVA